MSTVDVQMERSFCWGTEQSWSLKERRKERTILPTPCTCPIPVYDTIKWGESFVRGRKSANTTLGWWGEKVSQVVSQVKYLRSKCEKALTVIFGKDTGKMQVLHLDVQALRWGAEFLTPAMCPLTSYTLTLCFQVRGGVSSAKNELIHDGFLKSWTKQSNSFSKKQAWRGWWE